MTKKLCLLKWRGMPMAGAVSRKVAKCGGCGIEIPKGSRAWRPLLDKEINGVMRMDRICEPCGDNFGTDKRYSG